MTWLRRLLRRRRHPALALPSAPDPTLTVVARAEAERAGRLLAAVVARDPEVNACAARAERIHRRNNLGPAFMRVLGGRRGDAP